MIIIITVIIIIISKLSLFHNLKTLTEKFFESFLEKHNKDFPKMNIVANILQTKPIYFGKYFFTSGMCLFETFS